jgi:propionyl-CoA carboxylase alpha chain
LAVFLFWRCIKKTLNLKNTILFIQDMQMFDLSKANKKIKKVLIANRGEIASRIIATLKKMNIESIAVYSDLDKNLQFVQEADIAIPLNGKNNQDTYLNGSKIIQIAKELGIDAIHPGYGFLSENQEFSKSVTENGIEFIGPSFKSVSLMGDKLSAKEFALQNKVNVVPGFVGLVSGAQEALQIAKGIGMPVIIKAVAGGGGKGMKIVYQEKDFEEAYINATSEARNNFKDDRVFIEKYVENPRHIEIQILGDKHGNVICLGERECSIQRFNQKIVEEAPSTFVTPELRAAMIQQSATLAKAAGYYSAGTIEYIVDKDRLEDTGLKRIICCYHNVRSTK